MVKAKNLVNAAIGKDNTTQASTIIKGSEVKGATINTAAGQNMVNAAIGNKTDATQSSIVLDQAKITGAVANTSIVQTAVNAAIGNETSAYGAWWRSPSQSGSY